MECFKILKNDSIGAFETRPFDNVLQYASLVVSDAYLLLLMDIIKSLLDEFFLPFLKLIHQSSKDW